MAFGSTYSTQLRAYLHSRLEYHNIDKHDWITGNWIHFLYLLERRKKIVLCAILVVNCAWYKFRNVFFCIHLCRRRFFLLWKSWNGQSTFSILLNSMKIIDEHECYTAGGMLNKGKNVRWRKKIEGKMQCLMKFNFEI